jgi:hypothetical protein
MPGENRERDVFAASLRRTAACPAIEELEQAAETEHVRACAYCQTELQMLRSFTLADVPGEDAFAVKQIVQRLKSHPVKSVKPRKRWWDFGGGPILRPVALVAAGVLMLVGFSVYTRSHTPPLLDGTSGSGADVFRSQALTIQSPVGDLRETPDQVRWEAVSTAATYQIQVMEVDRNPIWTTHTSQASATIPAAVRAVMVPAKTLLCEVTAFDAQGRKVAQSEVVRFRVLQNLYSH